MLSRLALGQRSFLTHFIGGQFVKSSEDHSIPVENPATEAVIARVPLGTQQDVENAVISAKKAFPQWSQTQPSQRAQFLSQFATKIRENHQFISQVESLDAGKPIFEAYEDIKEVANIFDYYSSLILEVEEKEQNKVITTGLESSGFTTTLRYEPVGLVAAITPWNYPLLMVAQKVAPALAAGCTIVLKPSELTPLTAHLLAALSQEISLPEGVFNVVIGDGKTGAALVNHPLIDKISFTGSIPTGSNILSVCAKQIKRSSMELGGKSPIIVFDDILQYDQPRTESFNKLIEWIMMGFVYNQGEVCSATSRLLVQKGIAEQVIDQLVKAVKNLKFAPDPSDEKYHPAIGPLVSKLQWERVNGFVQRALQNNAGTLLCGAKRPDGFSSGHFYEPTIFRDVKTESEIWKEEVFGPVLCIRTFETQEEALELANDSTYGLAAAVFTVDAQRAQTISRQLRSGIVWNCCSQPAPSRAPWGGFKKSGMGRELGEFGLKAFLEVKQVTAFDFKSEFSWYNVKTDQ
eukprot:TRINITY_DN138_c0_g1_i3.p1 TRINITY_DN138_c0_g1~~TRINITY_DN138_c0_g1_i3.p1  ORF type:complete len:519 (-),score=111.12 TRINITY_DN138_c0_g1_i3:134-1690(-)